MENIEEKIKDLNSLLACIRKHFDFLSPKTRRVVILSFLSDVRSIVMQLAEIEDNLTNSLSPELSMIDFKKWLLKDRWKLDNNMYDKSFYNCEDNQTVINYMTDYFTQSKSEAMSLDNIGSLKTGLNTIWNDKNLTGQQIVNALNEGIESFIKQLNSVYRGIQKASSSLFVKFFQDVISENKEGDGMELLTLNMKIADHNIEYDKLEEKRTQYLYKFLKTKFLSYTDNPSKRDIAKCKLIINEMHLDADSVVDDRIKEHAARFEPYITIDKNGKIILNEERLGKYIFDHNKYLNKKELATFISALEMIQNEMDYLLENNNETEQQSNEVLNEAKDFIVPLDKLVKSEKMPKYKQIWDNIFENFKEELQDKGKQKNTTFNKKLVSCIIGCLKNEGYYDCSRDTDLAAALGETPKGTCRQYINQDKAGIDEQIYKKIEPLLSA